MGKMKSKDLTQEEWLEQALVPESEWPYQVPGNWRWVRLGAVTNYIQRGKSPKYSDEKIIPVVSQKCVQWTGFDSSVVKYITPNSLISYSDERFIQAGDILWNSTGTGTLGRVALYSGELDHFDKVVVDSHVTVIRTNRINHKFAYYFLISPLVQDGIEKRASGTTNQIELSSEMVKGQVFPLPPLTEQQRIVERIESLFEKLDQAKGLIHEALDSFENRKAAILHKAFNGELTKKWREENGVGMGSWEWRNLNDICSISSGGTPSRSIKGYYSGDIPWIKTGEIKWGTIKDSEEKITLEAIQNSSARIYPKGSVLLAMYGQGLTRGRAAILEIEAATNQAVCVLVPRTGLTNKFLYYFFMCNYWRFREEAVGGNQPNLSGKIIGEFKIRIPKIAEQVEIVNILDDILSKEEISTQISDLLDDILSMKKSILARAFRGELGTNDIEEEKSISLLVEGNN